MQRMCPVCRIVQGTIDGVLGWQVLAACTLHDLYVLHIDGDVRMPMLPPFPRRGRCWDGSFTFFCVVLFRLIIFALGHTVFFCVF